MRYARGQRINLYANNNQDRMYELGLVEEYNSSGKKLNGNH